MPLKRNYKIMTSSKPVSKESRKYFPVTHEKIDRNEMQINMKIMRNVQVFNEGD